MTLRELIETLRKADPNKIVPHGFHNPHSYRGIYSELAFEPVDNVSVAAMLADAESALGHTFTGYKGGQYTMGDYATVWIANYGESGEEIGPLLLSYMLATESRP